MLSDDRITVPDVLEAHGNPSLPKSLLRVEWLEGNVLGLGVVKRLLDGLIYYCLFFHDGSWFLRVEGGTCACFVMVELFLFMRYISSRSLVSSPLTVSHAILMMLGSKP